MINGDNVVAENKDKFVRLIAKLLELTQEQKIKWRTVKNTQNSDPSMTKIIGAIFETDYKFKKLRIYKRERNNTDDNRNYISFIAQFEKPSYTDTIILGFTDEQGNIVWSFPQVSGVRDLYEAVAYQVAEVDDFINDILKDEE